MSGVVYKWSKAKKPSHVSIHSGCRHHKDRSLSGGLHCLSSLDLKWREWWCEPSQAEPGWMGCKQGVRGALLEAAGLSLSAVPCRAEPPRPPYYSLLQKNSSGLNEKSFPGGEAGDQLVTSSASSIMAAVRERNKLLNRLVRLADALAASQWFENDGEFQVDMRECRTKLLPSCCSHGTQVIEWAAAKVQL